MRKSKKLKLSRETLHNLVTSEDALRRLAGAAKTTPLTDCEASIWREATCIRQAVQSDRAARVLGTRSCAASSPRLNPLPRSAAAAAPDPTIRRRCYLAAWPLARQCPAER